jgi:outer membrane protein assembly factor BamB
MKQSKILFLVVIALGALLLVSCIPGAAQPIGGWSGTTVHDGIIYVGTRDGRVVAITSTTRSKLWDYTIIDPRTTIYTTPIVHGDLVYIGTHDGRIFALTIDRGSDRWVYPRRGSIGAIVGSPVIANDTIYISSSDGRVYALDITFGDLKWRSEPLADKLWTSPVVHGDTLYVSTFDGHIYALSAETGKALNWSFQAPAGFASPPVIYGDTIFLGSFDRYLYAIRIGGDTPEWRFPREKPAGNWFWASPIVREGIIYAGCLDGRLYAINATTGKEIWAYTTRDEEDRPSPIVASPVLMDNLLIVVNESGTVYVFDLNTEFGKVAELLETISVGAEVKSSFSAQEGLVYIRGEDNQLYVVDIDKGAISWELSLATEE